VSQTPYARPIQSRPRAVHLTLRDGDTVDGGIYLNDGQALAPYLGTRKHGWVNIVNAVWGLEGEVHRHAVLQTEHIVIASSTNQDYPIVASTPNATARAVDILLEDGTRLQGNLLLGAKQRLSDYLAGTGTFFALLGASRVQTGDALGDVAVNAGSVKAVRDAKVFAGELEVEGAPEDWGGIRRGANEAEAPSAPVNVPAHPAPSAAPRAPTPSPTPAAVRTERVVRTTGSIELVTPAPTRDRRRTTAPTGHLAIVDAAPPPAPAAEEPTEPSATPEQQRRAAVAARHWLGHLAVEAGMTPPDGRDLGEPPTLAEIWHSVAKRNEMTEVELAVMVASTYKLDVADFEEVTPQAIRAIPAKLARRLGVLPVKVDGRNLVVAVSDPESLDIEQQLGFISKRDLKRVIATPADISGAIAWYYQDEAAAG
jgi:Type II secretion system (T2SS), protein E, N-terminal domain